MVDQESPFGTGDDPREALQEVLRAIKRNTVGVVFSTLVLLMLGYAITLVWPSKFVSTTEFKMNEQPLMSERVFGEVRDVPLPRRLATLEQEFRSRRRIDSVMAELGWIEWQETAGRESLRRDLALKIKKNLGVQMQTDPMGLHHILLSFQWTQPDKAAGFVNALRDHYIQLTLDRHRQNIENRKEILEGVVAEREEDYQEALRARQKFEREMEVPRLLTPEVNNQLKGDLLNKTSDSKANLDAAINKAERIESELASIEPLIEQPVALDDPELLELQARLVAAEDAYDEAKDQYTPLNPIFLKAKREYDQAKRAWDEEGGPMDRTELQTNPKYYDKAKEWELARDEEAKYRAQVTSYEEELDAVQDRLDKFPVVQQEMSRLESNVELASSLLQVAKEEVQPYRDQVAQLRRQQFEQGVGVADGIVSTGPFEILEVGVVPETPVMPIGAVIMALSLIIGLTLGLIPPLLKEFARSSYGSVKEVTRSLGVPVLGAVDLILTRRDVRARWVQHALTVTTMVLVLVAMATALYIYTNLPEVLPAALHRFVREMRMALT